MGFLSLLEVAAMPVVQVLLISFIGVYMASDSCNLLPADARKSLNKIVFVLFTPSLMFASLAKTVTLEDIISWWFMPVNIAITFTVGGFLGWIVVKILKPVPHLEGLVIAACSSGNLGNLVLIVVPAICDEEGSPFGDTKTCSTMGLSYASFSMALGGFYIWTYTYQLVKSSSVKFRAVQAAEAERLSSTPNKDLDGNVETRLLKNEGEEYISIAESPTKRDQDILDSPPNRPERPNLSIWAKVIGHLQQILEELMAPPTLGAIVGLIFGAVTWLKNLIIGEGAPLRVIQDSIQLMGDATIPCITLILGGNLAQGLRDSRLKKRVLIGIVIARFVFLPLIGVGVVKAAAKLGFLPSDPLFQYVLMIQFTLPPAMNIGTMTQLFDVGQDECSVIFLWTYVVAALALTLWSTAYLWILTQN